MYVFIAPENLNTIYRKSLIKPVKQETNSSMSNVIICVFYLILCISLGLSVCRWFYCLFLLPFVVAQ